MNENLDPELHVENENALITQAENVQSETSDKSQLPESMTKEMIIKELKQKSVQKEIPLRTEIDALKQSFYRLRSLEIELDKGRYVEDGGNAEDFLATVDPAEEEVKSLLNTIKDRRAAAIVLEEKLKEDNLTKKLGIIDAIKNLTESSDDFGKLYKEFKDLQHAWNEIKAVPQAKANELWKSYQLYTEKFYDLLKINNEFRDYDFKKNLEIKTNICESVEKLINEDTISAFHQLQNYHQTWRETGPVTKDLREDLWMRFKSASTEINKKYQAHFEGLKMQEENNLLAKTAICEELKALDYSTLDSYKKWDEKSKEIIELQAKWKTIGFVPRKVNSQIFEEFRALCDKFFEAKAAHFKVQKDEMELNLEKKRALCEKVNALKDSTDWKKTTDELIAIQKEWKQIGSVSRKYSDAVWKEFVAACDHFFEQKKLNTSSHKEEELANLALKKEIVEKLKAIDLNMPAKEAISLLREYMHEWHQVGFVPFKEKDKIGREYQTTVDAHFDRLKVDKSERRFQSFKTNVEDIAKQTNPKQKLLHERDRLMYQFNKLKSDLQTYENNMGFLSVSKGGGGFLLKEMNIKIQDLRDEMELIIKKVEAIDTSLQSFG